MQPQAKIHAAQIMEVQIRAGQNFDSIFKILEWVIFGIIMAGTKGTDWSCAYNDKPEYVLDHIMDNVRILIKQVDVPMNLVEDVVKKTIEKGPKI